MKGITISDGSTVLRATLNDTVAAKDFEKRLPMVCSGYDSGMDYCCNVANGLFDPLELQTGWKNGDLSLGGGWFAILYGGEEQSAAYRDMMIIGHVDSEDLPKIDGMPKNVNLTIRKDEVEE